MKWFKRCWLSIVRRPGKSILLFLVIFAMSNLLAGALAIITACETIERDVKNELGAEASITGYFYLMGNEGSDEYFKTIEKHHEIITTLCEDESVSFGEYQYNLYGAYTFAFGEKIDFNISSVNIPEFADIRSGDVKLLNSSPDHRLFTQDELDNGELVIITSKDLGQIGDSPDTYQNTGYAKPGNKMTITIPVTVKTTNEKGEYKTKYIEYSFEATIVGSCYGKHLFNNVYIPASTFNKIVKDVNEFAVANNGEKVDYEARYAVFKLNEPDDLVAFDEKATTLMSELPNNFEYESSRTKYDRNAGPVENLDTIAKVILIVAIFATITVLSLVVLFNIFERKSEMGIYVSLGEKSKNIIFQVICEVLLVSVLAISGASVTGMAIGNKLSDYMLEVQRYIKRKQDLGDIADLPVIYKPVEFENDYSRNGIINNFEATYSAKYFVTLYSVGTVTMVISCIIPMAYITKLKPKDILM